MGPVDEEEDFSPDLTEEYLSNLQMHGTANQIRQTAISFGVSSRDSTKHIISRLREKAMESSDFNKKFLQICGRSGGVILACCPHRITYALKMPIRRESARDYYDIIKSFKHQLNIAMTSRPFWRNMLTREIQTFHPHEGRLAKPTDENIQKAKEGTLRIDLPQLLLSQFSSLDVEDELSDGVHPVTKLSDRYSLSDTLHFRNLKNPADVLRNSKLVSQLRDQCNTQAVEQSFQDIKQDSYWFNPQSPLQYAFMCRLLCHLRNVTLNKQMLDEIDKSLRPNYISMIGPDGRIIACMPGVDSSSSLRTRSSLPSHDTDPHSQGCHETPEEAPDKISSHRDIRKKEPVKGVVSSSCQEQELHHRMTGNHIHKDVMKNQKFSIQLLHIQKSETKNMNKIFYHICETTIPPRPQHHDDSLVC